MGGSAGMERRRPDFVSRRNELEEKQVGSS